MISIKNLNYRYDSKLNLLNNITIDFVDGEKLAFTGDNPYNAKNMFFRIMTGSQKYDSGEIYYNHKNLSVIDFSKDYSMAYIPEDIPFLMGKTVYQNLEFIYNVREVFEGYEGKIYKMLEIFSIFDLKDTKIKKLTPYQKYVVALCRISLRNIDCFLIENIPENLGKENLDSILEKIDFICNQNPDAILIVNSDNKDIIDRLNLKNLTYDNGEIKKS